MNNCNWTAGPWDIRQPNGEGNGYSVGPAWLGLKTHTDECKANAHLISTAPELYKILNEFDRFCSADPDYIGSPFEESVRLVLTKARGETE